MPIRDEAILARAGWIERRWPGIAAGYSILLLVVAAIADLAYAAAAPADRPIVIRLAAALPVAIALLHIRSRFRGDPLWDPASEFEDALVREPPAPQIDPALVKLRAELANSIRSRSYCDDVLWPRLRALVEARGGDAAMFEKALPPKARPRWRGASRHRLAALIDRIESQP